MNSEDFKDEWPEYRGYLLQFFVVTARKVYSHCTYCKPCCISMIMIRHQILERVANQMAEEHALEIYRKVYNGK